MPDLSLIKTRVVPAGGIAFTVREAGEGPLVLCVHGFPDTADSWDATLIALAGAGFHAVAPHTRGIPPTSSPADGDYRTERLGEDVLHLITALGAEDAVLIGHDWGAMAVYLASVLAPERVRKLVAIAIPPPRALKPSWTALRGAWHFAWFRVPWLSDAWMRRNDYAAVDLFWRLWSPKGKWTGEETEPTKAAYRAGGLEGALAYYRQVAPAPWSAAGRSLRALVETPLRPPTLLFAGGSDGAAGFAVWKHWASGFEGPAELEVFDDGGHFLHLEEPERFTRRVIEFLTAEAPPIKSA